MKKNIFVFDVESTDLHGTGFAVGAIVINIINGTEIDRFELLSKEGSGKASDWVKGNVIPHLKDMPTCETNWMLREMFYDFYIKHKNDSEIWSDCNFPVETNFLTAILNDDQEGREWKMPYPLKDISTIVDIDIDRSVECGISGLRKHHPFDDAIASAYLLLKYLPLKL